MTLHQAVRSKIGFQDSTRMTGQASFRLTYTVNLSVSNIKSSRLSFVVKPNNPWGLEFPYLYEECLSVKK